MTAADLANLLHGHNRRSVLLTIGLAIATVFCWPLSYFLANGIVGLLLGAFFQNSVPQWFQPTIVGGFMLLLGFEIWRQGSDLFNLRDFHESAFNVGQPGATLMGVGMKNPYGNFTAGMRLAWVVSQIVLMAPVTTASAIHNWRSRVAIDQATLEKAAALYKELSQHQGWKSIPLRQCLLPEFVYLNRAGLLWIRQDGKFTEVQTLRFEQPGCWAALGNSLSE